jgi:hypothetical protein
MLPLAIILLLASLALLAGALRGRTTARSLFCRRCKFDLAGLTPARDNPTCPECGRNLAQPNSTRTTLRRTHRTLAITATLLLLVSLAMFAASNPRPGAWLARRAPDPALLWLHRLDVPGSHDEICARLSDTQNAHPRLTASLDVPLERVLESRRAAPLEDQRLILAALAGAQLTDQQARTLFQAAIQTELAVRSLAHPHQTSVPSAVRFRNNLIEFFDPNRAYQSGGVAYSLDWGFDHGGLQHAVDLFEPDRIDFVTSGVRYVGGDFVGTDRRTPFRKAEDLAPTVGSTFEVHAGVQLRLRSPRAAEPLVVWNSTIEQTVTVAEPSQPLVPMRDDPAAFQTMLDRLSISILFTPQTGDDTDTMRGLMAFVQHNEPLPADAVYTARLVTPQLQLRSQEPVVLREGPLSPGITSQARSAFQYFSQDPADQSVQTFLSAGTADLWLIPDPQAAYDNPFMESCLAGDLIFRGVKVLPSLNETPRPPPVLPERPTEADTRPD